MANNAIGESIDWEARIKNPEEWMLSHKLDGGRVEIPEEGIALSREMKIIKSSQVQGMAKYLRGSTDIEGMLEAEFWSPGMTFSEIMHFFKTEDVTSPKTKAKYQKLWARTGQGNVAILKGIKYYVNELTPEQLKKSIHWKYPGRTPEWLTTWHDSLKFYLFDHVYDEETRTKEQRYKNLRLHAPNLKESLIIPQFVPQHIDAVFQAYDQAILDGGEGLVIMKRKSLYKRGRMTIKEAQGYKIKDDNQNFEGRITRVPEGTVAKEGTAKTINAFGRSKTSQLAEDREPSGMAKGFDVVMDDGRQLLVSFSDFKHEDRVWALRNPNVFIGRRIKFSGAPPVKIGGSPRHAHFKKGDFLDDK